MKYSRDSWKDNAVFGRRRAGGRWWLRILVWLIILALAIWAAPPIFKRWERLALGVAAPAWRQESSWAQVMSGWSQLWQPRLKLAAENAELSRRLRELEAVEEINRLMKEENLEWRALFGRVELTDLPLVGRVIAPPEFSPTDVLLVDLGLATASTPPLEGDLAVVQNSVLLGRVESVAANSVKVKLFSASGERLPVLVGKDEISTEAVGLGGGSFAINLPRGASVAEGDLVTTSLYREGFLLGTVTQIEDQPSNPFQSIIVKSPVNLQQLDRVELYVF